jgi:hypothetical protein
MPPVLTLYHTCATDRMLLEIVRRLYIRHTRHTRPSSRPFDAMRPTATAAWVDRLSEIQSSAQMQFSIRETSQIAVHTTFHRTWRRELYFRIHCLSHCVLCTRLHAYEILCATNSVKQPSYDGVRLFLRSLGYDRHF